MIVLKQKLTASAIHLGAGLVVVLAFLAYCRFVAYTPTLMRLEGGQEIALLILGVDVAMGPLMTFVLYRKGKRGLKTDIALVLVLQIGAFLYGAWTLCSERPLYLAFVVEHFRIMPAADLDTSRLRDSSLAPLPFGGPRVVYVERPTGAEAQRIMWEASLGGRDVQYYPEYYRPFSEHLDAVRERAWTLERVRTEHPQLAEPFQERLKRLGIPEDRAIIVPVVGHLEGASALLDPESGRVLGYVDAEIW